VAATDAHLKLVQRFASGRRLHFSFACNETQARWEILDPFLRLTGMSPFLIESSLQAS